MIASELRPAARTLAGSPRTTLVSVLLLALGVGANTVLFALGDAVIPAWRASRVDPAACLRAE